MIEISIFTKPNSSKEFLLFSFDNTNELFILKKFLRNGAENVTFRDNTITVEIKENTDFKTALELEMETEK